MPFAPSAGGGANWYPPSGGYYMPLRGSMGAPGMGMASLFPDMTDRLGPMGNAAMQTVGYFAAMASGANPMTMMHRNMTPVESMYGRAYQSGLAQAVGTSSEAMMQKVLTAYHVGMQGGGALSEKMKAKVDADAKHLGSLGLTAVQMAPYMGLSGSRILSELPGVSLYQGIREMRGGTMLPSAMDQRIQQNLMASTGGQRSYFAGGGAPGLSAGERGTLLGALSQRGLVSTNTSALAGEPGSAKTQFAMRKLESTTRGWEELAVQLKGIFGSGRGIDKLLEDLDRALGGGMAGMGPKRLSRIATGIQTTMLMNHVSAQYVTGTMAQSAQAARGMGLVGSIGAAAGMSGINIGEAMVSARGGTSVFGQRSAEELSGIMTRRLLMGHSSTFARVAGGTLDLMRGAAVSRGLYREGMSAGELARAVGAPAELARMATNLQTGANSAATLKYFSESGTENIARILQGAGITGTMSEARDRFRVSTRGGQEMVSRYVSDKTMLGVQDAEVFKRVTSSALRRTLAGRGIAGSDATSKIAAIQNLFLEGAGVNVRDPRSAIAAIARGAGVSQTTAQSVFNTMTTSAEGDPRLRSMGGLEEMYNRRVSATAMERRQRIATSLAAAGNYTRRQLGPDTIIARVMDDLTAAPNKDKSKILARYLGDKSGGKVGQALTAYATATTALEEGLVLGKSKKEIEKLWAGQKKATDVLTGMSRDKDTIAAGEQMRLAEYEADKKGAIEKAMEADTVDITTPQVNITQSGKDGSASYSKSTKEQEIKEAATGETVGHSKEHGGEWY